MSWEDYAEGWDEYAREAEASGDSAAASRCRKQAMRCRGNAVAEKRMFNAVVVLWGVAMVTAFAYAVMP